MARQIRVNAHQGYVKLQATDELSAVIANLILTPADAERIGLDLLAQARAAERSEFQKTVETLRRDNQQIAASVQEIGRKVLRHERLANTHAVVIRDDVDRAAEILTSTGNRLAGQFSEIKIA